MSFSLGTGKTTTLTEIILQILTNIENSSILITTQSNSAADLIVQRLIKFDQVNCNNLLRIVSIKHFQKKGVLPDDIKDYTYTVDDLLPDSESNVYVRLSSAKRFRVVSTLYIMSSKNIKLFHLSVYFRSLEHRPRLLTC